MIPAYSTLILGKITYNLGYCKEKNPVILAKSHKFEDYELTVFNEELIF
ncbi:MAG: hypothetical protein ACD_79C01134G0002 [uncultured bacterium]|nr:MAG: hypothetical protein ACD_79C01134G0002 [uncultured bacterium]